MTTNAVRVVTEQIPGPRGPTGATGATGTQGGPGVDAIVKPVTTTSTLARAAQTDPGVPGSVRAADTFTTKAFAGVFTASKIAGESQPIQHAGPIYPADYNLGAGIACAVGCNSSGALVRVTDPTCVSGLNYVGYCDVAGTITVAPELATEADVTKFGLDSTGITACDDAFAKMCTQLAGTKVTTFYFPAGKYLFAATINYLPRAVTLRGDGLSDQAGARYYTGSGTRLLFSGAGDAIVVGDGTNTSSGGCIRDLEILGIRNTDVDGQSTFQGTAPTGAVDPTNINDRGIHLYGAVGFTLKDIRMGGFKRQISVDGGGSIYGDHIEFSGGGDGYGYQSMLDPSHKPATVTAVAATKTYTLSSGSWIAQGFKAGRTVNVGRDPHFETGDFTNPANYGNKTIVAVTDLGLTVAESLADETATHAWFRVNLQDDSARAIEIGSFDFVVPVSANIVTFDRILFNNTQVGVFHQSGTSHVVSRSSYEIPTWAWLQGAVNVLYHSCSGEGAQSASLLLRHMSAEGSSSVINFTVDNCLPDPHFPLVAPDATYPCGANCLLIRACDFDSMGIYGRYPVEGASSIAGLFDGGGNRLPSSGVSEGALCEGYTTTSSSAVVGHSYGHSTKARAAHHFNLYDYSIPMLLLTSEGRDYVAINPPASQLGKELDDWRQVYSSVSGLVGMRDGRSSGWSRISAAAASTTTAAATTPRAGSGVAVMHVTGQWVSDETKVGYWRIHQRYARPAGVVSLIGSPVSEYAENADGFVAPTLAVTSNTKLVASLSAHATEDTIWSARIEFLHTGS